MFWTILLSIFKTVYINKTVSLSVGGLFLHIPVHFYYIQNKLALDWDMVTGRYLHSQSTVNFTYFVWMKDSSDVSDRPLLQHFNEEYTRLWVTEQSEYIIGAGWMQKGSICFTIINTPQNHFPFTPLVFGICLRPWIGWTLLLDL